MSLKTLETQIRDVIDPDAGTLILAEIKEPAVNHILENIAAELTLGDAEIIVENKSLNITGIIDLPSISNIRVKLCFECGDGTDIETCGLHLMTISGYTGDLARDLGIAPIHDILYNFSPPSDQAGELSIFYSLKTKEFTINSEAGFKVPYFNIPVTGVTITIAQKLNQLDQMVFSVDMQGTFHIGDLPIKLGCKFPGDSNVLELRGSAPLSVDLSTFLEECLEIFNIPVPPSLTDIGVIPIANVAFRIVPEKRHFSAVVTTTFGEGEFVIMQRREKEEWTEEWMMILALSLDINAALDMIGAPNLPPLVSDAISNSVLIISNKGLEKINYRYMQPLQTVDLAIDLIEGINFQASFKDDLITDLLNVDSLSIAGSIAKNPLFFELLAKSTLEVNIANVFIFKGFLFGISYDEEEKDYSIKVGADMDLHVGEEILLLAGEIKLGSKTDEKGTVYSLGLSAYMRDEWKEPFGLKGFTLHNLGVNLGFESKSPYLPKYGIMADVTIGSFSGSAAIAMKSSALQLLSIEFNELNIGTIVRCLLVGIAENIPDLFFSFLDEISLENVKLYYAIDQIKLGGVTYNVGLHMKATLNFLDFQISAEALLDPISGVYICSAIDPINISSNGFEIIKLTNATDTSKGAMLELDLRNSSYNLHMVVSGAISIFGGFMKGLVDINIDESGFNFLTVCSIVDLFEASLEVTGPNIANFLFGTGEGIYLRAYMKNDLLDYIRENILNFIKDVTKSAVDGLTAAQNDLIKAQKDVEDWDKQIAEMRALVQSQQDAVVASLVAAQNAVTAAQNEVNKIDSQINSIYSRINRLNSDIRWWNNWYNSAPWWEKSWKWTRLVYEVGWRSAEITGLYVSIGALQVARAAAWAILEIAKIGLKIAEAIVVIADPSLDPRVIALVAARAVAWTALKVAEGIIVVARAVVSGFSSLTQFVVEWGLGGVFNITSASFEADFNGAKDRTVALSADIVLMGISSNIEFSFNFDDPMASVMSFAEGILRNAGVVFPP